jgi:hypothetical protein
MTIKKKFNLVPSAADNRKLKPVISQQNIMLTVASHITDPTASQPRAPVCTLATIFCSCAYNLFYHSSLSIYTSTKFISSLLQPEKIDNLSQTLIKRPCSSYNKICFT